MMQLFLCSCKTQETRNIPLLKGKYMHLNTLECLLFASVRLIRQSKSEGAGATNPYFSLESEIAINDSLSTTKWKWKTFTESMEALYLYFCPERESVRALYLYFCPERISIRALYLYFCPERTSIRALYLYFSPERTSIKALYLYFCPERESVAAASMYFRPDVAWYCSPC